MKQTNEYKSNPEKVEYPISKGWIALLVFLVCGGAVLELIRIFF